MASFSSATVDIGESTKKSAHDRLMDNTVYLLSDVLTFAGAKTFGDGAVFQGLTTFSATSSFGANPQTAGIDARTATGSVSIEAEHIDADAQGGKVALKTKVLEIGDWDMNADATKEVTHGIARLNLRSAVALIQADNTNTYFLVGNPATSVKGDYLGGSIEPLTSVLRLWRVTDGFFDSVGFDSTSFNRGWITIIYEE